MKVPLGMGFLIADTSIGRRTSPKPSAIACWIGAWRAECLAEISDGHKKTARQTRRFGVGGGGGNRTPVRKSSALGPTCLAWSLL